MDEGTIYVVSMIKRKFVKLSVLLRLDSGSIKYKINVKNGGIKRSVIANHCWSNNQNFNFSEDSII